MNVGYDDGLDRIFLVWPLTICHVIDEDSYDFILQVEAHVRLQMIKKKVTMEGEMLAFHQFDMNVGYDDGLDRIFLVWPLTICHVIDEDSHDFILQVEAHVRLQMIKKKVTMEGEMLAFHQFDMNVGYDDGLDRIFLVWPLTICHVIDEDSPLYEYSADELANARFEIVAILEGIVESTGMTTQARTSWLPSEVIWGHRFEKLVTYQRENGDYKIDYARFHNSYAVDTPMCSAKDLKDMQEEGMLVAAVTVDGDSQSVATTADCSGGNSPARVSPPDAVSPAKDVTSTSPSPNAHQGFVATGATTSMLKKINSSSNNNINAIDHRVIQMESPIHQDTTETETSEEDEDDADDHSRPNNILASAGQSIRNRIQAASVLGRKSSLSAARQLSPDQAMTSPADHPKRLSFTKRLQLTTTNLMTKGHHPANATAPVTPLSGYSSAPLSQKSSMIVSPSSMTPLDTHLKNKRMIGQLSADIPSLAKESPDQSLTLITRENKQMTIRQNVGHNTQISDGIPEFCMAKRSMNLSEHAPTNGNNNNIISSNKINACSNGLFDNLTDRPLNNIYETAGMSTYQASGATWTGGQEIFENFENSDHGRALPAEAHDITGTTSFDQHPGDEVPQPHLSRNTDGLRTDGHHHTDTDQSGDTPDCLLSSHDNVATQRHPLSPVRPPPRPPLLQQRSATTTSTSTFLDTKSQQATTSTATATNNRNVDATGSDGLPTKQYSNVVLQNYGDTTSNKVYELSSKVEAPEETKTGALSEDLNPFHRDQSPYEPQVPSSTANNRYSLDTIDDTNFGNPFLDNAELGANPHQPAGDHMNHHSAILTEEFGPTASGTTECTTGSCVPNLEKHDHLLNGGVGSPHIVVHSPKSANARLEPITCTNTASV